MDWNNYESYPATEVLALAMEVPINEADWTMNIFKGWFIPPATTRYRFYQTCDDHCSIELSNVTEDSTQNVTEILYTNTWVEYRDWYSLVRNEPHISEWISLTEGLPYYIEGKHYEGGGGDHYTVAVEIEATAN